MSDEDFYMVYTNNEIETVIKLLVFPKNSEEYKNELSVLLEKKASQLDKKSQEILQKFNLTLNNECLVEKDIKSLPNLFSGSIESTDYEKFLNVLMHDISKTQLLTQSILEYLISYLEKVNLQDDSCIKNHHMITILYMLLYFFYGENGCNFLKGHENNQDKKSTIIEIGMYLSDLDVSLQDKIEPIFLKTCGFLKNLLHHKKYPILNFKARDICHHFNIKLDLSLMIRLCIEGVRLENEDIENLILFIGNSGSGKSATINYLYGIVYRLIHSMKTQNYFLKQVNKDVIAPAKVGHGNVSETLFPKIIQLKGRQPTLSLCDFPGLNDTRDDTYKTCASLGLPIAVHYAKKKSIGAIVVVIDWETIKIDRGEKLLNTIKTVKSLMKEMRNDSVKLLYAITRPPIPPDEKYRDRESDDEGSDFDHEAEYCDSDRLKEKVFNILKSNSTKLAEEIFEFGHRNDLEITRLHKNNDDLRYYKAALSKIDISLFESHANYFGFNIEIGNKAVTKSSILSELINKLDYTLGETTTALLDKHIEKILQYLEDKKVHSYSTSEKSRTKIVNDLTNKEIQITNNKFHELSQEIKKINEKLEEKKSLIDFLEKIELDDIYIIRGFKLNDKWEDHKENLLKRLEEISTQLKNKDSQSENELEIDGRSQRFSIVLDWTKGESNRIKTVLNYLLERKEYKEKLIININELDERIKDDENNLRLALVSSRDNENEIMENLKKKLNILNEKKEKVKKEFEQASKDIDEMNKRIQDIEESPAIEYGSKTIVEKRSKLTQFLGFSTFYSYTFPKVYYEKSWSLYDWLIGERKSHNLPIDRVEISYLINKEEKIVFKTPFASNSFENQIDPNSITIVENIGERPFIHDNRIKVLITEKEKESDFKYIGEIIFKNFYLEDGILEVEYLSHKGEDGFFGVRCYVKPIHFPENKLKIENFKIKISEKEKEKLELEKQLEDVNNEVNENNEHYECAVKGLYDENKGKYLLKFLIDLEYSPEDFVDILLKEIKEESKEKEDLEWLEKDENFKEIKKAFANYDAMKDHFIELIQMNKNILQGFIFSKDETQEIEDLEKEEQFEADKFDFQRLLRLYKISRKSGLSFIVLRQIVKSLRDQNTKGQFLKRTLREEIEKLTNSVNSFKIEKELFEKREWVIDVLETVVEVLSYRDLEQYTEFRKAKESYDATDFKTVLESANNIINRDKQPSN